mmetsp:Transcript_61125/g.109037  ORF Transcript_61125/g.109037 Transcript_61125/m.109037 type:complete len:87 (-) Transcript_61125:1409-1669(-)
MGTGPWGWSGAPLWSPAACHTICTADPPPTPSGGLAPQGPTPEGHVCSPKGDTCMQRPQWGLDPAVLVAEFNGEGHALLWRYLCHQ